MSQDFESKATSRHEMRVSLRGKLSKTYTDLRNNNEAAASRWIRKLVADAGKGHPQLLFRMEDDSVYGGQKFVVGLKSEVGRYADW